jgi:hypothetical protein
VPVQEDLHLSVHSGSTGAKPETRAGLRSGEVEQDERLQALVIINLETVLCSANQSLGFPTLTLCRLLSNITSILVFGKKQALRRQPLTTQIPQLTNRRRIHPEMQREDAMRGVFGVAYRYDAVARFLELQGKGKSAGRQLGTAPWPRFSAIEGLGLQGSSLGKRPTSKLNQSRGRAERNASGKKTRIANGIGFNTKFQDPAWSQTLPHDFMASPASASDGPLATHTCTASALVPWPGLQQWNRIVAACSIVVRQPQECCLHGRRPSVSTTGPESNS